MENHIVKASASLNKMVETFDDALKSRNRITMREFSRYIPLFLKDGISKVGEHMYVELSNAWNMRVSLYHPVDIVEHDGPGAEVLLTLPPVFTKLNSLNEGGKNMTDAVNFFNNAIARDNVLSDSSERATMTIIKCLDIINNEAELKAKKEEAEEIEKQSLVKLGKEEQSSLSLSDWF